MEYLEVKGEGVPVLSHPVTERIIKAYIVWLGMSPYWDMTRHHIYELDNVLKNNREICEQVLKDHYGGHYYELLFDDMVEKVAAFSAVSRLGSWNELTDVSKGTEVIETLCSNVLKLKI